MTDQYFNRIAVDKVQYLAFEGGGGKGIAFPGAIRALEHLKILKYTRSNAKVQGEVYKPAWMPEGIKHNQRLAPEKDGGQIKGISGASAGAITAFLLSCGYNSTDILEIMVKFDFDKFFESPEPRFVPKAIEDTSAKSPLGVERRITSSSTPMQLLKQAIMRAIFIVAGMRMGLILVDVFWGKLARLIVRLLGELKIISKENMNLKAVKMLYRYFEKYIAFLDEDLGLFPGFEARKFFAEALAFKLGGSEKEGPRYNATFADHFKAFGVKLVVTGTNMETKKSGLFSVDTTPHFPVADAVRISMGLPLLYKPYVIRKKKHRSIQAGRWPEWLDGVWVDGGYFNNIPIRVFDHEEGPNPKTLGLRLSEKKDGTEKNEITSFLDFIKVWPFELGFWGVGEAHLNPSLANYGQTILLDSAGLSLLNFKADIKTLEEVTGKAQAVTLAYFANVPFQYEP